MTCIHTSSDNASGLTSCLYRSAVDFFNILAYDYHASTEALTDHHAPLFALPGATEYDHRTQLNVVSTTAE